jgi:hemoglobin
MGRGLKGWIGLSVVMAAIVVGAYGCATMGGDSQESAPSLYKRLGGREGIALVVGDFVGNMAADARVSARFKDMKPADVEKLKSNIADQICDATGGPCSYLGRDMKTTHKGMKITEAEWNATVENLGKALDKNQVGAKEKQELIGALAPMKGDIVGQ